MILQPINSTSIGANPIPLTITAWDYTYDLYSLNDTINITTRRVNYDSIDGVDMTRYNHSYNDWGGVSSLYYRGRDITLTGSIKASSHDELKVYIDSLKNALSKKQKILKIDNRTIRATMTKLTLDRDYYNINWCPIEIVFTTVDPYWSEWAENIGYPSITWTINEGVSYIGTAPSTPTWIIVGQSWSTSGVTITHNGINLTINTTVGSGDVLAIDGQNLKIQKNGSDIDYSGAFPTFRDASNPFTIALGGIVADVSLIYDNLYR